MNAQFSIHGSAIKGWICPSKEGAIILRAYDRLVKLQKRGKVGYEAACGWCRFITDKKYITYTDRVVETAQGDFIAKISLTVFNRKTGKSC